MSALFSDLCPSIFHHAEAVIVASVQARHFLVIVDTLRTPEEQAAYLASGTSWTPRSKHLPQIHCPFCQHLYSSVGTKGLSHAIDLAPLKEYIQHGHHKIDWDPANPIWKEFGELGESYGLEWGGRWATPDWGHLASRVPFMG